VKPSGLQAVLPALGIRPTAHGAQEVLLPPDETVSPAQGWQVPLAARKLPAVQLVTGGVAQAVLVALATWPAGQGVQAVALPPALVVLPVQGRQVALAARKLPGSQLVAGGVAQAVLVAFATWPAGHGVQEVAPPPALVVLPVQGRQVPLAKKLPGSQLVTGGVAHAVLVALATWPAGHGVQEVATPPMLMVLPVQDRQLPLAARNVPGLQPTQVFIFLSHVCVGSEHSVGKRDR
jgi:hypothetical protein